MINSTESPIRVMPFGTRNYLLAATGVFLLAGGFWMMYTESNPHGFGWRALVASPLLLLSGFAMQFFAIFCQRRSARNH